jgi:hypothetical protein
MMIAVAIATMLVGSIYAALVSSQTAAASQAMDSGKDAARMRAVELLRSDLRARLKQKAETGSEENCALTLSTTADSLSLGEMKRMIEEVTYAASPKGMKRAEGKGPEIELATGPVGFEFWENGAWRKQAGPSPVALRVTFSDPAERVVIR